MIRDTIGIARRLITSKDTALATGRLQLGSFASRAANTTSRSNSRSRRISVSFGAVNAPKVIFHGLGFAPSGYDVLGKNSAGTVYNDLPLKSTTRVIVLKCNTANMTADLLVR